jgi:cyclopropane fatty-acyl-phospholipid synthase-like methyltransferase
MEPAVKRCAGWRASLARMADVPPEPPWSPERAYDAVAPRWRSARGPLPAHTAALFDRFLGALDAGASVLDVGCGSGVPVGRLLAERGFRLTGLDTSAALLAQARENVPGATFVHGDMRVVTLAGSFDAIIAWDSVFHVPRADHAAVFARFAQWLRPQGGLLLSLGGSAWEGRAPMLGEEFFYSGWTPEKSLALIADAGFEVLHSEIDDPSSRGHLAVLARRAR